MNRPAASVARSHGSPRPRTSNSHPRSRRRPGACSSAWSPPAREKPSRVGGSSSTSSTLRGPDAAAVLTRLQTGCHEDRGHGGGGPRSLLRGGLAWQEEDVQGHQLRQHLTPYNGRDGRSSETGGSSPLPGRAATRTGPQRASAGPVGSRTSGAGRTTAEQIAARASWWGQRCSSSGPPGGQAGPRSEGRARDEAVRAEKQARIASATSWPPPLSPASTSIRADILLAGEAWTRPGTDRMVVPELRGPSPARRPRVLRVRKCAIATTRRQRFARRARTGRMYGRRTPARASSPSSDTRGGQQAPSAPTGRCWPPPGRSDVAAVGRFDGRQTTYAGIGSGPGAAFGPDGSAGDLEPGRHVRIWKSRRAPALVRGPPTDVPNSSA
jgi:hypothetical protein